MAVENDLLLTPTGLHIPRSEATPNRLHARGRPSTTQVVLGGTVPLIGSMLPSVVPAPAVAPTPPSASEDGLKPIATRTYDDTLGVSDSRSGRTRSLPDIGYDGRYAALPDE